MLNTNMNMVLQQNEPFRQTQQSRIFSLSQCIQMCPKQLGTFFLHESGATRTKHYYVSKARKGCGARFQSRTVQVELNMDYAIQTNTIHSLK